jgi:AcrR family transcriptional regulator
VVQSLWGFVARVFGQEDLPTTWRRPRRTRSSASSLRATRCSVLARNWPRCAGIWTFNRRGTGHGVRPIKLSGITARRRYNAPQRRRDLADAAIEVLGSHGSRMLTHAKVDERAGMPDGTTSYYFRTRNALLLGIASRLDEHDTGALSMMSELCHDETAGYSGTLGLARLILLSGTEPWLTRSRARYELILATRHDPEIATRIVKYGLHFYSLTRNVIAQWHPQSPPPPAALIEEQTAMILTLINGIMVSYVAGFPAITDAARLDRHIQAMLSSITAPTE